MHSTRVRSALLTLTLSLLALGLLTAPLLAASNGEPNGRLVDVYYSSAKIVWEPIGTFGYSELVVSAPDGNIHQKYFDPGETLVFSIFEVEFELCDGNYGWEVRFMPKGEFLRRGLYDDEKAVLNGKRTFNSTVVGGNISVLNGKLVDPRPTDAKEGQLTDQDPGGLAAPKDFVILDDLIVDGSACIGFDCVNGESFGFDTIRVKENNLRIKFDDTSVAASFPRNDWQLTANDSANGGASKFSIDDISGGRTPFTVEANAPSHSLYVDDGGRLGLGTSTPSVDIHTISGDTPTLRLEQNGSSGFAPQTWDVAGNETSFFIRDVTNGSTLPFRIRPDAPSQSLIIDQDGDVGLGTLSPDAGFHLTYGNNDDGIHVETSASGTTKLLSLESAERPRLEMINGSLANAIWNFDVLNNGNFAFIKFSGETFIFEADGDLSIAGDFISNGTTLNVPDYVFEESYELMPLEQLETFIEAENHLPGIPSAGEINGGKLNMTQMQMTLLEKVEELTLYTLQQNATITELAQDSRQQQDTIAELQAALAALRSDSIAD